MTNNITTITGLIIIVLVLVFFSGFKSGMAGNTSFFLVWSIALIVAALGYGIGFHLR